MPKLRRSFCHSSIVFIHNHFLCNSLLSPLTAPLSSTLIIIIAPSINTRQSRMRIPHLERRRHVLEIRTQVERFCRNYPGAPSSMTADCLFPTKVIRVRGIYLLNYLPLQHVAELGGSAATTRISTRTGSINGSIHICSSSHCCLLCCCCESMR